MRKLNLIQGSAEWLACRKLHLGASDCASVMGDDIYKSKSRLFKEKVDDAKIEETDAMRYGKETEEEARLYYSLKYDTDFQPACFESDENCFMMASLDGWDGFTILEIKCLGEKRFREIQFTQVIPQGYQWQLQHALYVVDAAQAAIIGFYFKNENGSVESVEIGMSRDRQMIVSLLEQESIFWNENVCKLTPPESKRKSKKKT